jgi:peptidyl-prolyl cis-trans isomerase D
VFEISLEGDDLISAAEEKSAELVATDFFTRSGVIKGVADQQTFRDTAFGLKNGEISDVIEMSDGYYIIQVLEVKPAVLADFQEAESRVAADLKRELQDGKASADADQFLVTVSGGGDWAEALQKYSLENLAVGPIKRNHPIPDIGRESQLTEAAFQLTAEAPLSPSVIKGQRGYYIARLKDRKEPDGAAFDTEKEGVQQRLLQQKKMKVFRDWIAELKAQSEIEIKEDIL